MSVVIIVLSVLAIFSFTVPVFSAEEPYEKTETYTEEEPYETTETYYDTENYQEEVPFDYDILERYAQTKWNLKYGFYVKSLLEIRNTDDEGGEFEVNFEFNNQKDVLKRATKTYFIASGDSHAFICIYNTKFGEDIEEIVWAWEVEEPYKTVTKTRQVERERTVTETREVEKTRTVTEVREVDATLYELLF